MVDDLADMTAGHFDKIVGPTRAKSPTLFSLTAFAGALGWAIQFVDDVFRDDEMVEEELCVDGGGTAAQDLKGCVGLKYFNKQVPSTSTRGNPLNLRGCPELC
jgi:hypothetical protein